MMTRLYIQFLVQLGNVNRQSIHTHSSLFSVDTIGHHLTLMKSNVWHMVRSHGHKSAWSYYHLIGLMSCIPVTVSVKGKHRRRSSDWVTHCYIYNTQHSYQKLTRFCELQLRLLHLLVYYSWHIPVYSWYVIMCDKSLADFMTTQNALTDTFTSIGYKTGMILSYQAAQTTLDYLILFSYPSYFLHFCLK